MPLYEYRCKKCEHLEEVLQKASDPAPGVCPECGAKKSMEKEISLTSFQLKGGGWYKDLYSSVPTDKKGGDKGDAKADKKAKKDKPAKDKSARSDKKASKKGASGGTKAA